MVERNMEEEGELASTLAVLLVLLTGNGRDTGCPIE
jgi:hypothetical protein